jgi:acyl carrier protein
MLHCEISEETSSENTETWDSLTHMKLVIALEEKFNIEIESENILEIMSYKEIVKYLKKKGL